MGVSAGGSVQKAWFQSDDTGKWFDVQYNPVNFQFSKPVNWQEHEDQGKEASLEFKKNSPATMACELTFDTTNDGSDVRTGWVNRLLEFTNPEVPATSGEQSSLDKKRPHKVWFTWGGFEMLGVFETVDVTYIMFSSSGTPLRAKVTVKMKEWTPESGYSGGGGGSYYESAPVQLVTVGPGETITAIAAKLGSSAQAIMDANGIDDPFDIPAGTELAVPR
jgi:hypothetical protein